MTSEEKQLLLADLCARLPYGVKLGFCKEGNPLRILNIDISTQHLEVIEENNNNCCVTKHNYPIFYYRPYLRPMSSMTEEEENEYRAINCYEGLFPRNEDALDYVLSHHFDFRGLIPMGLAIEAKEGIYKTK